MLLLFGNMKQMGNLTRENFYSQRLTSLINDSS